MQYRSINLEGGRRALVKMKTPPKDQLFDLMDTMDEGDDEDAGATDSVCDDITTGGACVGRPSQAPASSVDPEKLDRVHVELIRGRLKGTIKETKRENIRGSTEYDDKDKETTHQRDRRLTETQVHIKGSQRAADSVGRFLSQRELQEAELQLADEIMHYHEAYTAKYTKARSAYLWKKSERAQSRTEKREKDARYQRELVDKRAQFKVEKQQVLQRLEQLRRRSKLTPYGGKKGKPRIPRAFVSVGLAAEGNEGGCGGGGGKPTTTTPTTRGDKSIPAAAKRAGRAVFEAFSSTAAQWKRGG